MHHTLNRMHRLTLALAVILCLTTTVFAQQIPQTMSFQAVIRDANNDLVANGAVSVRISILQGILSSKPVFTEVHNGVTNVNGQLSFAIGTGMVVVGTFSSIDWSKGPYFIRTETDNEGGNNYSIVGSSPLLSVPFAMRAQTADRITGFNYTDLTNKPVKVSKFNNDAGYVTRAELGLGKAGDNTQAGVTSTNWSLKGNKGTNSAVDHLGTTDYEDFVFVTYNAIRMRLTATGDFRVYKNFFVGQNAQVGTTLNVNGATTLNSTLDVDGATTLNNTLDADGATTLNGLLDVDGATTLNSSLDVDGSTTLNNRLDVDGTTTLNNTLDVDYGTTLNSTLDVDGATTMNNKLDVDGATTLNNTLDVDGATTLNSTLDVDGSTTLNGLLDVDGNTWLHGTLTLDGAVGITQSLDVGGAAAFYSTLDVDGASTLNNVLDADGPTTLNNSLDVDGATTLNNTLYAESDQDDHVVTIENADGGGGDGLLIKLGKTHGAWDGGAYLQIANPATIIAGSTLNTVKGWLNGASFQAADLFTILPSAAIGGALAEITNTVIEEINDGLNLPFTIVPDVQVFPGFTLPLPDIPSLNVPDVSIPALNIGPYALPAIPLIPTDGLPTIAIPNFQFTNVTNSLTRENHYMAFQDKDGRQTGAIVAESVSEWRDNTVLDDIYLTNLAASFIGIDLLGAAVSGFAEITQLVDGFNKIGVAYESGNGDYAEWLERENPNEHIVAGDIVGVRGGKISKDITGAEQTMVVSHTPIVLGNVPTANIRPNGNDVAFMGQVPVKIMGPVSSGDYIVATGTIKGYGKAVSASNMQLEDYTKVVGRSWQNIPTQGPKMVNTVIGVNHDDWVSSVKKLDVRQTNIDRRVDALESKLQSILGLQLDNKTQVTP